MKPLNSMDFQQAFNRLPLVAILRGIQSHEVTEIALALYELGFRLIEVPLTSPDAMDSIRHMRSVLEKDCLVGAGTVTSMKQIDELVVVGAQLVVMPHADVALIRHAKDQQMTCIPGVATLTEAYACIDAKADALKLFPAEMVSQKVLNAMKTVLPAHTKLLPVGGINDLNIGSFVKAGANGFGLGTSLYKPGMNKQDVVHNARRLIRAWDASLKDGRHYQGESILSSKCLFSEAKNECPY